MKKLYNYIESLGTIWEDANPLIFVFCVMLILYLTSCNVAEVKPMPDVIRIEYATPGGQDFWTMPRVGDTEYFIHYQSLEGEYKVKFSLQGWVMCRYPDGSKWNLHVLATAGDTIGANLWDGSVQKEILIRE